MKQLASTTFTSRIVREFSSSPRPVELGTHATSMTLFAAEDKSGYFAIEWDIPGAEETVGYGIWTENNVLVDYDGGFSLPMQAIELLRNNGITVPVEFE